MTSLVEVIRYRTGSERNDYFSPVTFVEPDVLHAPMCVTVTSVSTASKH